VSDAKKVKPCCPEGHTEGLELRMVVDVPFVVKVHGKNSWCDGDLDSPERDPQMDMSTIGSTCGVWCSECEEWYDEEVVANASAARKEKS
jgi:hypothetical protein